MRGEIVNFVPEGWEDHSLESLMFLALDKIGKDERFAGKLHSNEPGSNDYSNTIYVVLPGMHMCNQFMKTICQTSYFKFQVNKTGNYSVEILGNEVNFIPLRSDTVRGINPNVVITCFVDKDPEWFQSYSAFNHPLYRFV